MSPVPFHARCSWVCLLLLPAVLLAQEPTGAPNELPAAAATQLVKSLADSRTHAQHVWRDTAPFNEDGTVNGYIEISRGDRQKWEFNMAANRRAIDRIMPAELGGYPINYGFVPQTVSYDGDPFDVLVLGPPIPGGTLVSGVIVGLMQMEDEKGLDSKVVLSRTGPDGRPLHQLTEGDRRKVADYFRRYKEHEPGKFSKVPGWGSIADGLSFVKTTHAFFGACGRTSAAPCRVMP
jgi:inorganic pyrophosphatase